MTTARDVMHLGAECVGQHETLADCARQMQRLDVGSLPICGDDDRLYGILTDRDIVLKCVAVGGDPTTMTAGDLGHGKVQWVGANTDVEQVLKQMAEYRVRRMPVIEDHRLVGMISEGDLAAHLPGEKVGELVAAITKSAR